MNVMPTADQQAIADAAAAFLHKELAIDTGRVERAFDETMWRRCAELGWLALGLDTTHGGIGATLAEETLLHRELGRSLAPGPYAATTIAARVAAAAGDTELTTALINGDIRAGTVTGTTGIDTEPGHLALVIDTTGAHLHHLATVTAHRPLDTCSTIATVTLGDRVATTTHGHGPDPHLLARARVLTAAHLVGIAEACRDMSATYAATRTQFGKPIGAFQAVKHRCADMVARCETARSLTYMAAVLTNTPPNGAPHPDAPTYAAAALVLATTAATRNTAANIQNHGGIGFTTELGADRYTTRTHTLTHLFGPPHTLHTHLTTPTPTTFS